MLPRRLADYGPARLDELAARGEIVWVGAGAGGVGGGRVAIYFREDAPLIGPAAGRPAARGPGRPTPCARRWPGGASFWDDLVVAAARTPPARRSSPRSGRWSGRARSPTTSGCRCARRAAFRPSRRPSAGGVRRRRVGGRGRGAPSAVAGRWSLAERLFRDAPAADERRRVLAELLVERHGMLTRSAALVGGRPRRVTRPSTPPSPTWRRSGPFRRGYFVEGLGGAQFAMPGAVERLRDLRDAPPGRRPARDRPRRRRPRPALRRRRRRGRSARAPPARPRASSAPRSCWSTARPPSTWSAAGAAC